MIVQCIQRSPSADQAVRLGGHYRPGQQEFPVQLGRKYMVYGLRFWDGGVWIDIASDAGYIVIVPLSLFVVIDGRVPDVWEAHMDEEGNVELLPSSFHRPFFIDDLVSGDVDTLKEFWTIRDELEKQVPPSLRAQLGVYNSQAHD